MEHLTNEQLIEKIQNGDNEAKEWFVIQNKPLIYSIVHRFSNHRGTKEDLFQIGCIGLMKAIIHFDKSFEVKFSTYAVPIILGEIKRYFRDDGSIRISRTLKENYILLSKLKDELTQNNLRIPTYQELAEKANLDISDVILSFEANQFVYSLDEPVYENDGSAILLEDKVKLPDREDLIMKISLKEEIKHLSERERLLLYYRYEKGLKQDEIALIFKISQVQVSRLEKKILNKLKEKLV